jgi:hypothetical protein
MRTVVCALLVGLIAGLSACAARDARPAQSAEDTVVISRYREMTWAEYYSDVMEKAWKRGATVVWISPPNVRKAKRPMQDPGQ